METHKNAKSLLAVFRLVMAEHAEKDKDFVLFITEAAEVYGGFDDLPSDKVVFTHAPASVSLLRAAGSALAGKQPWLLGKTAEIAASGYSQIREAIAIPKLPVRIAALNGGVSTEQESTAEQLLEDIAIMRTLPGMKIFVPADDVSLRGITDAADKISEPLYLRLGTTPYSTPRDLNKEEFHAGGARILREGTGVTICACGIMVGQALKAAEMLEEQNISAEVVDCYSVKPFPERVMLSSVRRTGCCVTAEEAGEIGGLFGAAAECLGRTYPVPMRSVALDDRFVNSGTPDELREFYGLTCKEIVDASAQVWALRRR